MEKVIEHLQHMGIKDKERIEELNKEIMILAEEKKKLQSKLDQERQSRQTGEEIITRWKEETRPGELHHPKENICQI